MHYVNARPGFGLSEQVTGTKTREQREFAEDAQVGPLWGGTARLCP